MAYYKDGNLLVQQYGAEFDGTHHPGELVPYSGIYRCRGCGLSNTDVKGHKFPPQNHHQHTIAQGSIRWQLVVKSHWSS